MAGDDILRLLGSAGVVQRRAHGATTTATLFALVVPFCGAVPPSIPSSQDAHSLFLPPWGTRPLYIASFPPFLFQKRHDGWIVSNATGGLDVLSKRVDPAVAPHVGKTIESINGMRPEDCIGAATRTVANRAINAPQPN